ncbi:unnamed protein product [Rotaria socialis]|uniref:Uncharacterized protein n=1 Tax=Rotaria socialis TaxID=392032 RepID=A0A820X3T3_9BILA|nr:unnamed protein product [Rotaria socialis]
MATATAIKSGSAEGGMQFRTQMVNGKPQIYFDAIDESSTKSRPKRSGPAMNATRPPEPPKSKPSSQKPPSQNQTNKVTKKKQKVTFSEAGPTAGMFMTMDEISELVKTVQETTRAQSTIMNENNVPTNSSFRSTQQQEPSSSSQQQQQQQQQQFYQTSSTAVVPKLDLSQQQLPPSFSQPLAPISPRQEALGMMADKKRQKWMREKAEMDRMKLEVEYDQLKHQLSPMHQKASSSPERSAYPPGDFSSNNRPPLPPSMKQNDNQQSDFGKTRLMEKKQQQWKQENAEKAPVWNPFGRPGAGAPMSNELQQKPSQPLSNIAMPYRPPDNSSIQTNIVLNDQTHVPAAMRTNLLFGDVRFEDDVKTAKEMERRQWLDDLQRQIEDNKRKKSRDQETERRHDFLQDNIQPLVQEAANRHQQEKEPATPTTDTTLGQNNTSGQNPTKSNRHESLVQHTYDKILEATELAKYEKKAQLIEKLKRNGHKTDLLAKTLPVPHKQMFSFTREESDLPPQIPNHLLRNGKQNKKNVRIRSLEDTQRQRRPSISTTHSSHNTIDDGVGSQIGTHRSNYGTIDLVHRPLWNYQNPEHREYVTNSRRDPHYDKRPRQRNAEQENFDRTDDVQKRTAYNRWNSDSELQQQQQQQQRKERKFTPSNRTRPTALKQSNINKNEPIPRAKPPHEAFLVKKTDDESSYINISSLDKYEHFIPYTRTDDVLDPSKAFSPIPPSRETSAHTQQITTTTNDDHRRRQNTSIQPPPYHVPPSRQEHILQQLTAIKENLVRRQQEVTTSMNAIPV